MQTNKANEFKYIKNVQVLLSKYLSNYLHLNMIWILSYTVYFDKVKLYMKSYI